jgi:hypothetical protein
MVRLCRITLLLLVGLTSAPVYARGFGDGHDGADDRMECGGGMKALSYSPESTVQWTVQSHGCELNFRTGAPNAALWAISIIAKPKHGTAGVYSRYSLAYRPMPGFTGADSFAFAVIGRTGAEGEKIVVHVNVSVTP